MFEGSCSDLSSLPSRSMAPYYEVNAVDRTQGLPFFCRDFGCFFGTCGKTLVQHGPFA